MEHVYTVHGMTCQHCAAAVTEEISELSGVQNVEVDVESGRVIVTSDVPLDTISVGAAVKEAGYDLLP